MSNKHSLKRARREQRQRDPAQIIRSQENRDGSRTYYNSSGGVVGYGSGTNYLSQSTPMAGRFEGMTPDQILRAVAIENAREIRSAPSIGQSLAATSAVVPAEPWRARAPIAARPRGSVLPSSMSSNRAAVFYEGAEREVPFRIEEDHLTERLKEARVAGRTTLDIDQLAALLAAGHRNVSIARLQRGWTRR